MSARFSEFLCNPLSAKPRELDPWICGLGVREQHHAVRGTLNSSVDMNGTTSSELKLLTSRCDLSLLCNSQTLSPPPPSPFPAVCACCWCRSAQSKVRIVILTFLGQRDCTMQGEKKHITQSQPPEMSCSVGHFPQLGSISRPGTHNSQTG